MTDAPDKGFTQEQIACLMSALTKLELTAPSGGEVPTEHVYGTPLEDLCREEIAKYKLHPLDMWDRLEHWTSHNQIATGLDQFLLRHLGFFNVEPASAGYMIRLRLPACQMRGDQMNAIAQIADTYGPGHAHITTRGNLQVREIAPKDVLNVMDALTSAGLSCQGSGADSARNLTTSPTAGFDPVELIDLSPQTRRLSNLILNKRELRALPRKFNISFDNGGRVSAVSDSNDIAFQAINVGDAAPVERGVYCRIGLGGISGHGDLTRDTGMICTPDQTVMAGYAMLMVFVEHADRTNRKRARLKYVLDAKGIDWFIQATQAKLDEIDAGFQLERLAPDHDLPRASINRQGHIGIHQQSDHAYVYAGVALEMGRLSSDQMRTLGQIALTHGHNDIRLTVWQNVLIPHLPLDMIEQIKADLAQADLGTCATAFAAGAVACTGKTACKLGLAHTKEDGTSLVRYLETRFTLDAPINIHVTGCPNSCAQHYIGDIGLVGATTASGVSGYHIVLGGGSDQDKGIARPLCGPVPHTELNHVIEQVLQSYLERRAGSETFLSFVRSLPDEALPTLCNTSF